MLARLWGSALGMTWLALAVRLGGFAVLLPIVLAHFSAAEVSVWLAFSAIASFQVVADFGFGPTFSREIAYGFAGRSLVGACKEPDSPLDARRDADTREPDWHAIARATTAMLWLYRRIALGMLVLLAVFGTWAIAQPVSRVEQPQAAWIAWWAVVFATSITTYGNGYSAFLIGANRIDLQKRWETLVSAVGLLAQVLAVLAGTGLLGLVLVAQLGLVSQILVNRLLMQRIGHVGLSAQRNANVDRQVLNSLWPVAWRTAIGTIMGLGVAQGLAIAMANVLVAAEAASVQLALRVMQVISQFSQVPFYTSVPRLNRLRAASQDEAFLSVAKQGIRRSLWVYAFGVVAVDALLPQLLELVGSRTDFPPSPFWAALMLAGVAERYGAMHTNLLLTRNRVISHVANGVAGAVCVAVLVGTFRWIGPHALAVGMLAGYAGFYAWFSAWQSYRFLATSVASFELDSALPPALVVLGWASIWLWQAISGWRTGT